MKKLVLALPLLVCLNVFAATPRSEVQPLIDEAAEYAPFCKGNPDPKQWRRYCGKLNAISDKLEEKGWCWQGPRKDSPNVHYDWRVCRENTYEDNISNFISQWETEKDYCQKSDPDTTEESESRKTACHSQQFYERYFERHNWCFDRKKDIWSICPTTDPKQRMPNLIKHWKVLSEQCQRGYIAEDPYCSQLPDVESQLKNAGYCLKRKPSQTKTAIWEKCK